MAGANRSMVQLILELRESYSVEPFVLLPPNSNKNRSLKNFLEEKEIKYMEVKIPYFKQCNSTTKNRFYYVGCLYEIRKIVPKLKSIHFDLVHSNSSVIDFGGYLSKMLGVRHVWHLRDFGDLDYNLHSIWGKFYCMITYRNADVFIAISKIIKSHFESYIPKRKIHVIYNGIYQKEDVSIAKHNNEIVEFLCAGVINPAKNQAEIISAVNILVNRRNIKNLHLTIVGAGSGEYIEQLKNKVNQYKLNEFVTFLGEVDGIEPLASTMDVGIMSSHCEAFGRVTVEYMLQNLAVIANDSGANPEIIKNGETGLLYKHNSSKELADKMQLLINDRCLLSRLAHKGYTEAQDRFLSPRNSLMIHNLYTELLDMPKIHSLPTLLIPSYWIMQILHIKDVLLSKFK